jgi:hypothetical protein
MANRLETIAERFEFDINFRRRMHIVLTIFMLALVVLLIASGFLLANLIAPWLFEDKASISGTAQAGGAPASLQEQFPINTMAPHDKYVASVTPLPAVNAPTPTPILTPTPIGTPGSMVPGCPPLNGTPQYYGGAVLVATIPAPMKAGCPALLLINAPDHPTVSVKLSLTFGVMNQLACSVTNFSSHTDAAGQVAILIIVPPPTCFTGNMLTSGIITVGSDITANANLPAISN